MASVVWLAMRNDRVRIVFVFMNHGEGNTENSPWTFNNHETEYFTGLQVLDPKCPSRF